MRNSNFEFQNLASQLLAMQLCKSFVSGCNVVSQILCWGFFVLSIPRTNGVTKITNISSKGRWNYKLSVTAEIVELVFRDGDNVWRWAHLFGDGDTCSQMVIICDILHPSFIVACQLHQDIQLSLQGLGLRWQPKNIWFTMNTWRGSYLQPFYTTFQYGLAWPTLSELKAWTSLHTNLYNVLCTS